MLKHAFQALAAIAVATAAVPAHAGPYVITLMDYAGGTNSAGWDINNSGVFVGSTDIGGVGIGYIVSGGVTTALTGPAGATSSGAIGISDGGVVVGTYSGPGVNNAGYIYSGGSYTAVNYPGATFTELRGISPDGRYVTGIAGFVGHTTSFVLDRSSSTFSAVVDTPTRNTAQGVTNSGTVVGDYRPAGSTHRLAFTYDLGSASLTSHALPGGDLRYRGINESGLMDGWFTDAAGVNHGFVGSVDNVFDIIGATSTVLEGINDAGWLAGQYFDANGEVHAFLAQLSVSEPASLALLGGALSGLFMTRRRRAAEPS